MTCIVLGVQGYNTNPSNLNLVSKLRLFLPRPLSTFRMTCFPGLSVGVQRHDQIQQVFLEFIIIHAALFILAKCDWSRAYFILAELPPDAWHVLRNIILLAHHVVRLCLCLELKMGRECLSGSGAACDHCCCERALRCCLPNQG